MYLKMRFVLGVQGNVKRIFNSILLRRAAGIVIVPHRPVVHTIH
jgi:hypothetical protein